MIAAAKTIPIELDENEQRSLLDFDTRWAESRREQEPASSYGAGTVSRMNPMPAGIDPLGTDADYHYATEFNYFLMVERGRVAVRNHPLVESGINRLTANARIGDYTLDVNSGDKQVDADLKAWWYAWCDNANECDYEGRRTMQQLARQSFFSQCQDGDILHLPLYDGRLQTWEAHHVRNPYGKQRINTKSDQNGFVHGAEVVNGRTVAYHVTPRALRYFQSTGRGDSHRYEAFDEQGNKTAFWLGFTHRFFQRRGVSRLSAARDAMQGFADLNFAHIKSAVKRATISYLMQSSQPTMPGADTLTTGRVPQGGARTSQYDAGLGLEAITIEQVGGPAQVLKPPPGWKIDGWNANMPSAGFFEQAALLLTMLSVNLDIPLSFLLLDGSLVNFHGGRMTFDQVKLRLDQVILDQIQGLHNPVFNWKVRQKLSPGHPHFDRALYAAVKRGFNPFNFQFRPKGWPYTKPLEDAAAEDLAERRNLKSAKSILAARGVDEDEHQEEIVAGRGKFIRRAIVEAIAIQKEFPEVVSQDEIPKLWREIRYGSEADGVQLAISADTSSGETTAKADAGKPAGKPAGAAKDA